MREKEGRCGGRKVCHQQDEYPGSNALSILVSVCSRGQEVSFALRALLRGSWKLENSYVYAGLLGSHVQGGVCV